MLATTPIDAPWGYRQKVHFVFGATGGRARTLTMGHYARGSRHVVPVSECPVHSADGNTCAFAFGAAYARAGIAADDPSSSRGGVLKSLTVRVARHSPERLVTVVVRADADKRLRDATRKGLAAAGPSTALHVNLHPRDDRFIFGRETRRIEGPERLRDTLAGASFLISPTAFFQTNVEAANMLVTLVRASIPAGASVLDLYAGAGLFALPLALAGHQVTAVEENAAAVADGEASRALNRIAPGRCRFIAGRVETVLARLPACDVVILDPPREGCSPAVLEAVFGRRAPACVVYVSCNPETLARDVAAAPGYAVESLQPVDMFPHTPHVETVAVLSRRAPRRA
jgi:23S rRNA (uracil1939-C5)-methyltransferase